MFFILEHTSALVVPSPVTLLLSFTSVPSSVRNNVENPVTLGLCGVIGNAPVPASASSSILGRYPELRVDDDGNWFFNTSIAEQNNVWLGGYRAIIREMSAVKYDFFLDQVIKVKNEITKERLEARKCMPDYRPLV